MFFKKGVVKNSAIFTGKTCAAVSFNKVAGLPVLFEIRILELFTRKVWIFLKK